MISDQCSNWKIYSAIAPGVFKTAFDFIKTLTPDMEDKRYEICGSDIYVMVQQYTTNLLSAGKIEAHRHYIDIQTVISGTEIIGVSPLAGLKEISAFDNEKDIEFFEYSPPPASLIKLYPGEFMLLYAGEGHMPGIAVDDKPATVKKAVIKIRRELLIN